MRRILLLTLVAVGVSLGLLQLMEQSQARTIGRYSIMVSNRTSYTITNVMARNVNQNLGDVLPGTIGPGEQALVDLSNNNDDCVFRLKAVTSDGRSTGEVVKDICDLGTWSITDNGGELDD